MRIDSAHPKHIGYVWTIGQAIHPRILSVTQSICKAGYRGRVQSTEWTLDYSFTPFGRCKVGKESAAWKERPACEAHLYPPRMSYWEDTGGTNVPSTRGIFILFTSGETALAPSFTQKQYICFLDPAKRLGNLLERMLEVAMGMGDDGFPTAQAILWEIIGLLNAASQNDAGDYLIPSENPEHSISDFLQTIRLYLHEHLAERITRENMANRLNLSVSALAHRYYAETGEAPMTTLARMRIHVAKSLILKGHPLKLIAEQTGFYDEYHLSRTFKRLEGITAREFRRRQRQKPRKLFL